MDSYGHFKALYIKKFVNCEEFGTSKLIEFVEDIPSESKNYRIVVTRACALLSGDSSRLQHLKLLPSYSRYFETNNAKKTRKTEFALMLYILHYLTLRILRSPWRKDYLVMKTYNGFYKHVLCKYLDLSVIQQLLRLVGFRLNHDGSAFEFTSVKLGSSAKQFLTDAGIDFFLSYTQCRMRFDPDFLKELKQYQSELSKVEIGRNPRNVARYEEPTSLRSIKESRSSHRRHGQDLYDSQRPSSSRHPSSWSNGSIYEPRSRGQDGPLDLSQSESRRDDPPYSHKIVTTQKGGREGHLVRGERNTHSYVEDKLLYGSNELSQSNLLNSRDSFDDSPESSVSGQVYYPPEDNYSNKPKDPSWRNTDSIESRTIPPPGPRGSQRRGHTISPTSSLSKFETENNNYVTFVRGPKNLLTGRGSPDGEINRNERYVDNYRDSKDTYPGMRRNPGRPRVTHIYQEISGKSDLTALNDKDLYEAPNM